MFLRTNESIINLDNAIQIFACECDWLLERPCIKVEFSDECIIKIETEDLPTAQRKLDEIEHALRSGIKFFDMR